jgi:hypothetical protein
MTSDGTEGREMTAPTTDCVAILRARAAVSAAHTRYLNDPTAGTDQDRAYNRLVALEVADAEEGGQ